MSNDKVGATFHGGERIQFVPDVWADPILEKARRSLLASLVIPADPYARRGHYVRAPRWVRRFLPRRGWRWDETAAQHAERVAALPPRPAFVTFPKFGYL